MVCVRDAASGFEWRLPSRHWRACAAAAAQAQGALLDSAPLNVFADGLGAIQVRQDGVAAGLFYNPDENPAHAGLEIKDGDTYYPLEDGFRRRPDGSRAGAVDGPGRRHARLHTAYMVGPNLRVSEDITYTDGSSQIEVRYAIPNTSAAPIALRVGALADLFVGNNDNGNGVISNVAPRFVGGRDDASGLVYGLQEITPWVAYQEGDFELVFDNFAGNGLANTIDSAAPDNGVGAEFLADSHRARPAPSGPLAARRPGAARDDLAAEPPDSDHGVIHASTACSRRRSPARRSTSAPRGRVLLHPAAGQALHPAHGPGADPGRQQIDTRRGRVTLISAANDRGGVQHAWFYEGIFKVSQTRGSPPITELAMAETLPAARVRAAASAAQKKPKTRKLWGDGKGKFRTRGQFSSATVRGTRWVVIDRCDGTLTRVARGTVTVRDLVRKRTVVVRAGKQYLARKTK